ncbi:MAG TPA: hypothetical protein VM913_06455 [Sphingomicrobium sp.]|nr:hypothetical protein [Sphingomicrobium sp.]
MGGYVRQDDGVRTNVYIIADPHLSDYHRSSAKIHPISDDWCIRSEVPFILQPLNASSAESDTLPNEAVIADHGKSMNYNAVLMTDVEAATENCSLI